MRAEATNHTLSIGARLTLFYCFVILLAMVAFAGVANWRLEANFTAEHAHFMETKIAELMEDLADGDGNPHGLLSEIAKETAGTRLRQYDARVLADRLVLGETPGMAANLPISVFPASGSFQDAVNRIRHLSTRSHRYILASVALARTQGGKRLDLQIALDVTRDAALLDAFRRAMTLTFLVSAPALIAAGLWIAARGLAPLRRIADAAQAVTPLRLSARIPLVPPWPRDLAGLVTVFNAMLDRLEEAFGRLSRFSADLAHELRTPLSNLIGEMEVSLLRPRTADEYRATLESGLEECRRLSILIEDLLFLARAEDAEVMLHRECVAVAQICNQAIAQFKTAADMRNVNFSMTGDTMIDADPILLRQALTNLLSNAMRHSPEGATVRICSHKNEDGTATVAIHNSGTLIAAEHLPRLFDRFYQIDPARSHGTDQGTGLGLSIVQSIMALHGGLATIESAEDTGTTATLLFPTCASNRQYDKNVM